MTKNFIYSSNEKLTEHFNVSEFKCKCGGTHVTMHETKLSEMLEKLRAALKCSSIVINSGYRCPTHDKKVGGTGTGFHCTGQAADIVCYDKDKKVISSKIVSCAAQDLGFSGIANVDSSYTATHVDVGLRKWYGDETVTTTKSVTDDFYSYYGLTKANVYGKDAVPAKKTLKIDSITIDGVTYSGTLTEI